jgi:Fe2+ or Zn2+ uptake regulation protein
MTNDKAIDILSKRNYMCGECPFSGPDCQGCRLAAALDLAINALREKVDISNRALDLIDDLKDRGVINNHQRGTLRRAIILGDNTNSAPALVLNEMTEEDINRFVTVYQRATSKGLITEIDRPHGKWIFEKANNEHTDGYICSICGRSYHTKVPYFSEYNFCPNCGTDMRGDTE